MILIKASIQLPEVYCRTHFDVLRSKRRGAPLSVLWAPEPQGGDIIKYRNDLRRHLGGGGGIRKHRDGIRKHRETSENTGMASANNGEGALGNIGMASGNTGGHQEIQGAIRKHRGGGIGKHRGHRKHRDGSRKHRRHQETRGQQET